MSFTPNRSSSRPPKFRVRTNAGRRPYGDFLCSQPWAGRDSSQGRRACPGLHPYRSIWRADSSLAVQKQGRGPHLWLLQVPNPNYCRRLSNNLAGVERRFASRAGRDLILLTIDIDPEHDNGKTLADYAQVWRADPPNGTSCRDQSQR